MVRDSFCGHIICRRDIDYQGWPAPGIQGVRFPVRQMESTSISPSFGGPLRRFSSSIRPCRPIPRQATVDATVCPACRFAFFPGSETTLFSLSRLPVGDVNELLETDLPTTEAYTGSGLIETLLKRIPAEGDWIFTVSQSTERTLIKLNISKGQEQYPGTGCSQLALTQDIGNPVSERAGKLFRYHFLPFPVSWRCSHLRRSHPR